MRLNFQGVLVAILCTFVAATPISPNVKKDVEVVDNNFGLLHYGHGPSKEKRGDEAVNNNFGLIHYNPSKEKRHDEAVDTNFGFASRYYKA